MRGVCYSLQPAPPLRLLSLHPSLCMSTAFGNRPKDIPFFSLAVPRINRHEAAELLLLHHISLSRVQIKLFLLSGAHSGAKKKKKKKNEIARQREANCLKSTQTDRLSRPLFVKLTPSTRVLLSHQGDSQLQWNIWQLSEAAYSDDLRVNMLQKKKKKSKILECNNLIH